MEHVARGDIENYGSILGNSEKTNNVLPIGIREVPGPLEGFHLDTDRRLAIRVSKVEIFHREAGAAVVESVAIINTTTSPITFRFPLSFFPISGSSAVPLCLYRMGKSMREPIVMVPAMIANMR